ncbi:hypothetical protein ACFWFH_34310 [Streptomyces coelicoflavus]|uniref:hypothetical protein n=1 Tax=Streptomyces TaxID=1883 RepID=UPI00087C138E|nr:MULTISPECIES: hypothetical protein [unclassified Streptomyces]QFX86868.1 hypothetical protein GEV49_39255 [Streptomyces sp. SYP-A7193]REH18335.1 hypothetical protein BX268_0019 [Streptomyces sp. 2221.1]SDS19388.1 hypothetical protein SAMN05428941_0023 [Streptomyces sp. 2114.2]
MSAAAANRVGRFYTTARRHPWVLGKVADWKIPLGPYTPVQIAVLVGGGFLLVKTISWWSWMGPVPVVAWVLAVWAVRRPRVKGHAPLQAALGWLFLAWQPQGGRTGGRAARDRAARPLLGGFTLEAACPAVPAQVRQHAAEPAADCGEPRHRKDRGAVRRPSTGHGRPQMRPAPVSLPPVSGVQQLLTRVQETGGVR